MGLWIKKRNNLYLVEKIIGVRPLKDYQGKLFTDK